MIALSSDTETRPSAAMREAIARAEVGDEQRDEDPSVNRLLARVAELLGKPAALFLPTGTMCNLIAVKLHTRPGDVLLADTGAHVLRAESGGAGIASGVMCEPIDARANGRLPVGTFDPAALAETLARVGALPSPYSAPARLLCVEQTHNIGGGTIWPLAALEAISEFARSRGLAIHMDGARLMNAVVASGTPAARFAACVDTVWIDFTKGLGAPIGAVLAGSAADIAIARRYKHAFGGAMRQAGIAAAACLYALDAHVDRLAIDHRHARALARGLAAIPGLALCHGMPETNIVFFRITAPGLGVAAFVGACAQRGLRLSPFGDRLRAVTHLDVAEQQIEQALQIVGSVLADSQPDRR